MSSAPPEKRLTLDDLHAAWLAGHEQGKAERLEREIEDEVHNRLHTYALEMLGMAQRQAADKGPAWVAMITEQAEAVAA